MACYLFRFVLKSLLACRHTCAPFRFCVVKLVLNPSLLPHQAFHTPRSSYDLSAFKSYNGVIKALAPHLAAYADDSATANSVVAVQALMWVQKLPAMLHEDNMSYHNLQKTYYLAQWTLRNKENDSLPLTANFASSRCPLRLPIPDSERELNTSTLLSPNKKIVRCVLKCHPTCMSCRCSCMIHECLYAATREFRHCQSETFAALRNDDFNRAPLCGQVTHIIHAAITSNA